MQRLRYDLVLSLVVALSFLSWKTIDHHGVYAHVDLEHYRSMAHTAPGIDLHAMAPFCYRILPSWLAGMLTPIVGSDVAAFSLLTFLAVLAAVILTRRWLVLLGCTDRTAVATAAFLSFSPHIVGAVFFNPFQLTDALSFVIIIGALIALQQRRDGVLAVILVVGALTRETTLIMIPVMLIARWMDPHRSTSTLHVITRTIRLAIPSLVTVAIVRNVMTPVNSGWETLGNLLIYSWKFTDATSWYRLVVNAVVPFAFLPFASRSIRQGILREQPHLVVLLILVAAASFVGKDVERLLAPAFPLVYLFLARMIDASGGPRGETMIVVGTAVGISALHPLYAHLGIPSRMVYAGASLLASLALPIFFRLRGIRVQ